MEGALSVRGEKKERLKSQGARAHCYYVIKPSLITTVLNVYLNILYIMTDLINSDCCPVIKNRSQRSADKRSEVSRRVPGTCGLHGDRRLSYETALLNTRHKQGPDPSFAPV